MAIPGMFSGLAAGAPQGPQMGGDDPRKRALLQMLMAQRQQGGQPPVQGMPNPGVQQPNPGMFAGLTPRPNGPQQPQAVPGAATPEQAASDRALSLRKAGASVGQPQTQQTGMFTPISQRSAAGNIFSGDKKWHSGLFDTTEQTSPFDSFFVNNESSNSWL